MYGSPFCGTDEVGVAYLCDPATNTCGCTALYDFKECASCSVCDSPIDNVFTYEADCSNVMGATDRCQVGCGFDTANCREDGQDAITQQEVHHPHPPSLPSTAPSSLCESAVATVPVLEGAIDNAWVHVAITNVGPQANVRILAVEQRNPVGCNLPNVNGSVYPNARIHARNSVSLRRYKVPGSLAPFRYTIHFTASSPASSCRGSVQVCVPGPGLGFLCDDETLGLHDASATSFCAYE